MLKALELRDEIADVQKMFEDAFTPYVKDSYSVNIGYQGGYANRKIIWMPELYLWAHFGFPPSKKGVSNRYWNLFGFGRPSGMVSIACEINPPVEAKKYPPAGVFAIDERDHLVILHRGKLTVTGGMSIRFLKHHIKAEWVLFNYRGRPKRAILVAKIPSDQFGEDIRDFVLEIYRVKELARKLNLGCT